MITEMKHNQSRERKRIKSKSCIWAKPNQFIYASEGHGVGQVLEAEAEVRWI